MQRFAAAERTGRWRQRSLIVACDSERDKTQIGNGINEDGLRDNGQWIRGSTVEKIYLNLSENPVEITTTCAKGKDREAIFPGNLERI